MNSLKRQLLPVYCKKCGRYLIKAPVDTDTLCPDCGAWTRAESKKRRGYLPGKAGGKTEAQK